MASCTLCKKRAKSGSKVSHSQIHTKRTFKPNLQKVNGVILCTRCIKTIKNKMHAHASAEVVTDSPETIEKLTEEVS